MKAGEMVKLFEDTHSAGSGEFFMKWFRANERAVDAAMELGIDHTSIKMKTFISLVVLRTLRVAHRGNTGGTGEGT